MPAAVATAPGQATLSPKLGGAALVAQPIRDAHITTTLITPPAVALVGSAVVGTSTVG